MMGKPGITVSRWIDGVLEKNELIDQDSNLRAVVFWVDPATTHLEMWTEFFDPPVPDKRQMQLAFDLVDEKLDFGATLFGQGKAFSLEKGGDEIPTAKVWSRVEGRDFLIWVCT